MPWSKLSPALVEEIVRRHEDGATPVELATEYGVSSPLIAHHLRKHFGPRQRGKLSAKDRQDIVQRWKAGEVAAHLAKEFGVGFSAVSKLILKETGRSIGRVRRRNEVVIPDDPVVLSYLAAMIDAEGCITRNSKTQACTWQVVITNTSPELEAWLQQFGGNFYYVSRQRRDRQGRIKQCFEWKVTTAWNIYRLLTAVLPYLVIKKSRALEALYDISSRFGFPSPDHWDDAVNKSQLSLNV